MADEIPEWATERAMDLIDAQPNTGKGWAYKSAPQGAVKAFARYIARNEQPPVDPVVLEARRICAKIWREHGSVRAAREYEAGLYDDHGGPSMSIALAALKRGMELAGERQTAMLLRNRASGAEE